MLGGTEVAHWLAFRLVYPNPYERGLVLQQTGHSYFSWLPLVAAIGCALLFSALVLHGKNASRSGVGSAGPGLSRFAVLPPLTFALQEHLERLISSGTVLGVVLEPTFMLGVALTLPFTLVAYLVARLLLGVAERVGQAIGFGRTARFRRLVGIAVRPFPGFVFTPRVAVIAAGHAERCPPF
ncbi:MAG: hypothetical protein ACRD6W_17970 [Nitrososphaerales archaeon]